LKNEGICLTFDKNRDFCDISEISVRISINRFLKVRKRLKRYNFQKLFPNSKNNIINSFPTPKTNQNSFPISKLFPNIKTLSQYQNSFPISKLFPNIKTLSQLQKQIKTLSQLEDSPSKLHFHATSVKWNTKPKLGKSF
jgi:hypothetical protein